MENRDKIIQGLEKAYKKLIEYKKYKKSPLVTMKGDSVVEVQPNKLSEVSYIHK